LAKSGLTINFQFSFFLFVLLLSQFSFRATFFYLSRKLSSNLFNNMFSFRVLICALSLSVLATAETVRGAPERRLQQSAVGLGTAGNYVILASSGISSKSSAITGDIAVSPIAAAAMTGFNLVLDSSTEWAADTQILDGPDVLYAPQVIGQAFAPNYGPPTPGKLTIAVRDALTAYTDAAGRPNSDGARVNLGAGLLGGVAASDFGGPSKPLTPGVYTFSANVLISGNLHFQGSATDIFIIQVAKGVTVDAGVSFVLGNVLPENIFWQVAETFAADAGAVVKGILLIKTTVVFEAGATLDGRILTQTACTLKGENRIN
jgi:hypothetical protein